MRAQHFFLRGPGLPGVVKTPTFTPLPVIDRSPIRRNYTAMSLLSRFVAMRALFSVIRHTVRSEIAPAYRFSRRLQLAYPLKIALPPPRPNYQPAPPLNILHRSHLATNFMSALIATTSQPI